jgi:hypothetical protein
VTHYSYLCDSCGLECISETRGDRLRCLHCGANGARRRFGFRITAPFQDHYNTTVGAHVTNKRDFADKLKVAAAEQTKRTGIFHDYVPVDAGDREAFGITDDHLARLEPTNKRLHDQAQS